MNAILLRWMNFRMWLLERRSRLRWLLGRRRAAVPLAAGRGAVATPTSTVYCDPRLPNRWVP